MIDFYKEHWEAKQIILATELESYFESMKNELIEKTIDSIINTGILFGEASWDEENVYKNGKWYERETNIETTPPQYYPWKDEDVTLFFDQPIIFNFGGTRLEIEYTFGSLVKVAANSIDTNNVRFYSGTPDIDYKFSIRTLV